MYRNKKKAYRYLFLSGKLLGKGKIRSQNFLYVL